ncbi:hypothetical protein AMECASPLE_014848, partial [Ameca splendens]
ETGRNRVEQERITNKSLSPAALHLRLLTMTRPSCSSVGLLLLLIGYTAADFCIYDANGA